ncbi:hypothetical protein, partial [Odoribacter splanchnicus]|uniref:hypothetical protein n=1 Tax=Odoribacter splanchnicus TaxID=28118 RepID=UPI001957286A
ERPLGYEPNELPLLHPAILVNTFCIASAKVVFIFYNPNIREEKLFLVFVKIGFCAVILYTFV